MNELHDTMFAYPGQRKYPLHTKEAALNSFKAFVAERTDYPLELRADIVSNFSKAASYYDLKLRKLAECEEECDTEKDKEESGEKADKPAEEAAGEKGAEKDTEDGEKGATDASEEVYDDDEPAEAEDLEVVLYSDDDEVMRCTPIESADAAKSAVEQLKSLSGEVPEAMSRALAEYILKSVAELNIELPEEDQNLLEETAGAGVGDKEAIHDELLKRASLIEMDRKSHAALYKYAAELEAMPDAEFLKHETLTKMCSLLTDIDNNFQLTGYYGKKLTEPRKVCYADTANKLLKQASDLLFLPELGAVLSKKALLERTDGINFFFKEKFGDTEPVQGNALLIKVANTHGSALKSLLSAIM